MSRLLITFYGDDFTGSTDALEQLTLAGVRSALFLEPPTRKQLARFPNLEAVGVAGITRSLATGALERELRPALKKLKALGAPHVHYKVCSTFDSSPKIGSIGRAIDVATVVFKSRFVPVLVAMPTLGRYSVFGNLFARFGIGSEGEIHRLDRHPSVSKHPITPMLESDLRRHLAKQTKKRLGLFDILKVALPAKKARVALERILAEGAEAVLFDALCPQDLGRIGELINRYASSGRPLFSVGSSGIEAALGVHWSKKAVLRLASSTPRILVGSGSCSPVTTKQIAWALRHGFVEVALNPIALSSTRRAGEEIGRATRAAAESLKAGSSVIIHTTRDGSDRRVAVALKNRTAQVLGTALGEILRAVAKQSGVRRVCIAGGDTSGYAARALGIEALEMIAPLTPGAPLCRAFAPDSPVDGCELVFKGGQVGAENYFEMVKRGRI